MPTMFGWIWAQNIGFRHNNNAGIDTVNLGFNNRDITADSAIALISHGRDSIWAECGFSRVVSNGVAENFDPPVPRIKRSNVTSITFRNAASNCQIRSRWVINVWTGF